MTDHDGALLDRDMGLLLAAASRAVISLYRPLLKPFHLTHPQYLVMLALHEEDPRRAGDRCSSAWSCSATSRASATRPTSAG
jgi:hypothetical protein